LTTVIPNTVGLISSHTSALKVIYEGHPKSFQPRHIWQQYFLQHPNEKFTNIFVRAFTKSDASGLHFSTLSYRLENCHATV